MDPLDLPRIMGVMTRQQKEIIEAIGVPREIFEGKARAALASTAFEELDRQRVKAMQEEISKKLIAPMLDKYLEHEFPHMYWELAFAGSKYKCYRRRTKPQTPTIEW